MPVTITSKSFQLLEKLGVAPTLVASLKDKGIKLKLGLSSFQFLYGDKNLDLANGEFNVSINDLMAGNTTFVAKEAAGGQLTEAAMDSLTLVATFAKQDAAVAEIHSVLSGSPVTQAAAETVVTAQAVPANQAAALVAIAEALGNTHTPTITPTGGLPLLKDATAMYQKVRGTSQGSVYAVVAFNNELKVAARIHSGANIAVRVEPVSGTFSDSQTKKLAEQSITVKGTYASGHFTCDKVPVSRVLGAVLIGLGLGFTTPLPDAAKVAAVSV